MSERSDDELRLAIDPGNASPEVVADVLRAISNLHRAAGGSGLKFRIEGDRVVASPNTPVAQSWTEGRHVSGTLTFQWRKDEPMPDDLARLRDLHMADAITEGELPNVAGKVRFRVNAMSFSIGNGDGMRYASAGVEVLD